MKPIFIDIQDLWIKNGDFWEKNTEGFIVFLNNFQNTIEGTLITYWFGGIYSKVWVPGVNLFIFISQEPEILVKGGAHMLVNMGKYWKKYVRGYEYKVGSK